jgi:large repetitive protein
MLSASLVTHKTCTRIKTGFVGLAVLFTLTSQGQVPTISSFSPTSGGSNSNITITGTNLQNATSVKFGGVPAIFFWPVSSTELIAFVGNGASGTVNVTTPSGTASKAGFTFLYPPRIDSFAPATAGYGDTVTIYGVRFNGAQQIYFGSVPAESFLVISDSLIKARVANGASGSIAVFAPLSGSGLLTGFTHLGPVINDMSPTAGPTGSIVTLFGKNFLNTSSVMVGGVPATSFNIISEDTLALVVPAGPGDTIRVTTPRGSAFIANFNKASIAQVNPHSATVGDTLHIRGLNLGGATSVKLGSTPARWFGTFGDTMIKAVVDTVPAGSMHYIHVTTALYGTAVSPNTFYYVTPLPVINSFSPTIGGPGTVVTIKGMRFANATKVSFGGTPAASFTIVSDSEIKALVGNGKSGPVSVENHLGGDGHSSFTYTILPVVQSFSPSSGPPGTQVTIKGFNFSRTNTNKVFFGSVKAPVVTSTDTLIKITVPFGAGSQPFTVTNDSLVAYAPGGFHVTFPGDTIITSSAFSAGSSPVRLPVKAVGDFDNDGKPDLVAIGEGTRFDSNNVYVYRNTSTPGVISFDTTLIPIGISADARHAATGDMDADGKLDIVLANYAGQIIVLRNTSTAGNISFAAPYYSPPSNVTSMVASGMVISDLNQDGKPDVALSSDDEHVVFIFKNNTVNGLLAFSNVDNYSSLVYYLPIKIAVRILATDVDGDKRNDLVVSAASYNTTNGSQPGLAVLTNTGTNGNFGFTISNLWYNKVSTDDIAVGDIDGDAKPDLVAAGTTGIPAVSTFKNTTPGSPSFSVVDTFRVGTYPKNIELADINGDKKNDILVISTIQTTGVMMNGLSVLKNRTLVGAPAKFDSSIAVGLQRQKAMGDLLINDLDMDGKPDVIINPGFRIDFFPLFLRNKLGAELLQLCPPKASGSIAASIAGTSFQWQADSGGGFYNLANGSMYSGTNTAALQLMDVPSSMAGTKIRCLVDGVKFTDPVEIRFSNLWTGNVSAAWENPANWSCGTVPDPNTEVVLNTGNILISSNVVVKKLTLNFGVNLTVMTGYTLDVTH